MRFERSWRRAKASANDHQGGEAARIFFGETPGAVTAHGNSCEISALGVAVKFFGGGFQRGDGEVLHGRLNPPKIFPTLRHDHDGGNARAIHTNFGADAHIRLLQAIVGAFTGTVKEKNDGPLLFGGPIVGNENLVFVDLALQRNGAIEKAGVVISGAGRRGQMQASQYQGDVFHKLKEQKIPPCELGSSIAVQIAVPERCICHFSIINVIHSR